MLVFVRTDERAKSRFDAYLISVCGSSPRGHKMLRCFTGQVVNKDEFKWCLCFLLFKFKTSSRFHFLSLFILQKIFICLLCLFVKNKLSARKWSLKICGAYPLRWSLRVGKLDYISSCWEFVIRSHSRFHKRKRKQR